jgi:anti-sigma factor ChrR (cupin superfamily)
MNKPDPLPGAKNPPELASRYIKGDEIPWQPMAQAPGVEMKVLYEDKATGVFTGLFRIPPGGVVPDHVHTALEQTYVLEGQFGDEEGMAGPGDFIWRPEGNRHEATSPTGCIILGFFMKPNRFLKSV